MTNLKIVHPPNELRNTSTEDALSDDLIDFVQALKECEMVGTYEKAKNVCLKSRETAWTAYQVWLKDPNESDRTNLTIQVRDLQRDASESVASVIEHTSHLSDDQKKHLDIMKGNILRRVKFFEILSDDSLSSGDKLKKTDDFVSEIIKQLYNDRDLPIKEEDPVEF